MSDRVKNIVTTFLLGIFVMLQLGVLHSASHDDDISTSHDCVWCQLSHAQKTPVASQDTFFEYHLESPVFRLEREKIEGHAKLLYQKLPVCELKNKPPPYLI